MSLIVEHEPAQPTVTPPSLGEVACSMLASLDTLTLDAPVKAPTEFETQEDYDAYIQQVRFYRAPTKKSSSHGYQLLYLQSRFLLADSFRTWNLNVLRTDDSEGNRGYFTPQDERAAYMLELTLWRQGSPAIGPLEVIAINSPVPLNTCEPSLRYGDRYTSALTFKPINEAELAESYPFSVVKEIGNELQREASALLDLRAAEILA